MIKCYKNIGDDQWGGTWTVDREYDSGDMEADILWVCAWLLGNNVNKIFLEIDGCRFNSMDVINNDISCWQEALMTRFCPEREDIDFGITDEDFLL